MIKSSASHQILKINSIFVGFIPHFENISSGYASQISYSIKTEHIKTMQCSLLFICSISDAEFLFWVFNTHYTSSPSREIIRPGTSKVQDTWLLFINTSRASPLYSYSVITTASGKGQIVFTTNLPS